MKYDLLRPFLFCLSIFMSMAAFAYDCEVNGIFYNLDKTSKTATVTYESTTYNCYGGDVQIPEEIEHESVTYAVTSIGHYAFRDCSELTGVTIPNSITSILTYAFYGCSSLTELDIPNSVTSIGNSAFQGCTGLTEFVIPAGVTAISNYTFRNCTGLTEITIPNSVTSIMYYAFAGCTNLAKLILGNKVRSIGTSAFENCKSLTEVTIPKSTTSIDSYPFKGCSGLERIVVEEGNSAYDSREDCNAIIRIKGNVLIAGCKNTRIPDGVTYIENYAFSDCVALTELSFPESVTIIGGWAFAGCTGLKELNISSTITFINTGAFEGCTGIERITVEEGNSVYDSRENCNAIIKTSDDELVVGCNNTRIPGSVKAISNSAFSGCNDLSGVTLPDNLASIGAGAFQDCSSLTDVIIPESVTYIGEFAFYGCGNLTKMDIPNAVPFIGNNTFGNCIALAEVTIGNSVTFIGSDAFSGCNMLTSVTSWCTTPPEIHLSTFDELTEQTAVLYVPEGCKALYEAAEYWKNFLNIQEMQSDGIAPLAIEKQGKNDNYNLSGQKVGKPMKSGIYVVDGQKVIVK